MAILLPIDRRQIPNQAFDSLVAGDIYCIFFLTLQYYLSSL